MGKSSHHKQENKFKFQTFTERINQVDIDVIHRIIHHDDTPEENLTFFGEAIEKWTELNCTQNFADFRKEISSQIETFTQLVHHKDDIVAALVKHLQVPDSLALDALLDLTVQLSRDLQRDFLEYFPQFFQLLTGLLKTKDVDLMEQVFTALAYLFKYLWRYLVKDIQQVYGYFSELLGDNHREYIRNFAAESFAFLMRKVKKPSELFEFMFQTLEDHNDRAEGTGRLLFEMIKGVKGQLHSCTELVLPLILSKLGPTGKALKKSKLPLDLVNTAITFMFECVVNYINKDHVDIVWNIILSTIKSISVTHKDAMDKKKRILTVYLSRLFQLTNQIINYRSGLLVISSDEVAKTLIELLKGPSLGSDTDADLIELVTSLLLVAHTSLSVEHSVKMISLVIKKEVGCEVIYKFIESLLDLPLFEKDVLPGLVSYTDNAIKTEPDKTLDLLTKVILHKVNLPQDGEELQHLSEYNIDLGKRASLIDYMTSVLSSNFTDIARKWGVLVCIPHIRPLKPKAKMVDLIVKQFEEMCERIEELDDDQLMYIYQIIASMIQMKADDLFTKIQLEKIKALISHHGNNVHILRACDLYFTHAVRTDQTDILTEDRLLQIYSFLESNLSSPYSQIRKLSLRIMSHFEIRLPSVDDSLDQVGVFKICLDAENVPISVHSYREKQLYLQKLDFNTVQSQIPIGPFAKLPLRYLLGCLFLNFKYLWEPIQNLIATHAQGLDKEEFWSIFIAKLKEPHQPGTKQDSKQDIDNTDILGTFSSQRQDLSPNEEVDYNNYRIHMWKTMQQFPQICESKSRDIVPMFLQFLESEYYTVDDILAKSQNLLKEKLADESREEKMEEDETNETDEGKEKIVNKKEKKVPASRKHIVGTLLTQLQLLALFTNPKSLYKEAELKDIYMEMLRHKNGEVQKVVLRCLLTYKPKYLVPYKENFERLLDDKSFKSEIITFTLEEDSSIIKEEHRQQLLPVLMRILYGKMLSKTGKDSAGKSKSNFRRSIVLKFIMACDPKEISLFLDMIFSSFKSYTLEDPLTCVENIMTNLTLSSVIPLRKLSGCLHSVEMIVMKLAHRVDDYLDSLLKILLSVTATAVACLEHRDEISRPNVTLLKNIRQMAINKITQFFEEFQSYKFNEREISAVFAVAVWPQLTRLTFEGIYHPTPLMKLLNVWTLHSRYFLLLLKTKEDDNSIYPLEYLFRLLNVNEASKDVKSYIIQMVYNLLMSVEESSPIPVGPCCFDLSKTKEDQHIGIQILVPLVPAILNYIQSSVVGVKLKDKQVNKELEILSRLSEFVTDESQCTKLVSLILPFLAEGVPRSQSVENDILRSVKNLLQLVPTKRDLFKSVCKLFGHIQSKMGRTLTCEILKVVCEGDENLEKVADLVTELNAWDPKRVEEPDYLRRLAAFRDVNSVIKSMTTLDKLFLHAILVNSCFFIKMVDDLSLRDNATNCLVVMISQFGVVDYTQDVFRDIISQNLLPEIKSGIKHKDENVRQEFILLLSKLVDTFPTNPMFTDLHLLKDKDIEADFFENIRHIQSHKKSKALRRMMKTLESSTMKKEVINSYLLPITEAFLLDEKYAKVQGVTDMAIEGMGVLCRLLPWQQYSNYLKFYLAQMQKRLDKIKHHVKIIIVILDAFHFDLQNSDYAEKGVPQPAVEVNVDTPDNDEEEGEGEKTEEVVLPPEALEPESKGNQICSAAMATRIHLAISKVFIPKLQRYLTEKIKADEEHKMAGLSAYPEDNEILRVPLALAMVKLLQNLPQKTLEQNLPGVLLKVCNFLKSRSKDIRITARDTLVKIALSLGARYFPYILSELRSTLRRGYQLHVLGFTVNTLLRNLTEVIKPGDLDFCRASLQQIFHEELFGTVAEEKDIDAIKGKVFEAKTMKSFESYQYLAKYIGMGALAPLLQPIKQVLETTQSLKITRKIQEALRKVSQGLVENSGMDVEKTMIFVHSLITTKEEQPNAKKEAAEKAGLRPPSCLLLPPKPAYGGGKPKPNKKTNTHVLVEFGLEILYMLLKRGKLSHKNGDHLKLIDPFVPIIRDNLQSKYIKINILCLRCLGWILKFPLPSLKTNIGKISNGMFVLLKNYASVGAAKGDNFELVSLLFKTVTVLVRDVTFYKIKEDQLHVMLTFCEEDLHDHNRQSTAFSLFKAILSRKLQSAELDMIVEKIKDMSITADSAHVRRECRQIICQYLMDYPQGKVLVKHLEYYVTQLSYEIDMGRESALEMLATIFSTFPQVILVKYSGLFFIPMAAALVNDNSPKCKKLTALAMKSLLQQVDEKTRGELFHISLKWMTEEKVTLQTLGTQTCGLFVEVETTKFTARLSKVLPVIEEGLEKHCSEQEESEDLDHLLFSLLTLLTKICQECNIIRDSQYSEQMNQIWGLVKSLLLFPHNWVRTSSAQLFGLLFATLNPEDLTKTKPNSTEYLQIDPIQKMEQLTGDFVSQLQSHYLNPELADQIIKNMVFIAKVAKHVPDTEQYKLSLHWLARKMVREANHEVVSNSVSTVKRKSVFKWIAAISIDLGADELDSLLHIFLPALQRETADNMPNTDADLKILAQEVLDIIKQVVGVDKFTTGYAEVMQKRSIIKETRKRKQAVVAVTHPEVAARRKLKKNLNKKEAKKRKIDEFRVSKKIKRKKIQQQ